MLNKNPYKLWHDAFKYCIDFIFMSVVYFPTSYDTDRGLLLILEDSAVLDVRSQQDLKGQNRYILVRCQITSGS